MGLWVGKKFTFLGLDYYWGTQIGGQKGKGPKMPKTPAQAAVLVIGLLISVALSCWLVDALFNPDSGLNEAERLEKALRQVDRPAGYRLDALTVQEAEDGKYDVEMTFYHRRTGKGLDGGGEEHAGHGQGRAGQAGAGEAGASLRLRGGLRGRDGAGHESV